MKSFYRITPALSSGSNSWQVEFVKVYDGGSSCSSSIGYFKTLKRAKAVVAHFRRKPIEISARSSRFG